MVRDRLSGSLYGLSRGYMWHTGWVYVYLITEGHKTPQKVFSMLLLGRGRWQLTKGICISQCMQGITEAIDSQLGRDIWHIRRGREG